MYRHSRFARAFLSTSLLSLSLLAVPSVATALSHPRIVVAVPQPLAPGATLVHAGSDAHFDVVLHSANATGEQAFLRALSTPSSPLYRHFLTTAAFAKRYGAPRATVAAVQSYLTREGLHVDALSRGHLVLSVHGSLGAIAHAFDARVAHVRRADGVVVAQLTTPATLPAALASSVVTVAGLTSSMPMASHLATPRATTTTTTVPTSSYAGPCPSAGSSSGTQPNSLGGYTIQQQGQLYGLTSQWLQGHTGQGAVIAMYELGTYDPLDTHTFFSCYHLTPTIHTIKVDGGATGAYSDEATMDVEQTAALAPGAVVDVYSGPNTNNGPIDLYAKIADDNLATVVSTSWGDCENDPSGAINAEAPIFQQMAAEGMTVIAAAGDNGSSDCNGITTNAPAVDDPASQPFVTAVGGLSVDTLSPLSQTVWNNNGGAGGGGVSSLWSRPWWQRGALFTTDTSQGVATATTRMVPDLSLMADPSTGFIQYFTGGNSTNVNCSHSSCVKWSSIGGTSIGPPILSAIVAIATQTCSPVQLSGTTRLGFLNPTLYAVAATAGNFVDVTSGSNDAFNQGAYTAGTGYDLASGLGSPSATFVTALCPPALNVAKSPLIASKRAVYLNSSVTLTAFTQSASGSPLPNTPVTFNASTTTGQALFDTEPATASASGALVTVNSSATGVATVSVTATQPGPVTIRESVAGQTIATVSVMFVATPLSELVPSRPALVRRGASPSSLAVALVPYSTKVPPVQSYQLTLNQGKTWFSFTGHATNFALRNLSPGHQYSLELRAINANGAGPWSRPLRVVTPV